MDGPLRARHPGIDFKFVSGAIADLALRGRERPSALVVGPVSGLMRAVVRQILRRWPDVALLWWGSRPTMIEAHRGVDRGFASADELACSPFFCEDLLGAVHGALRGVSVAAIAQMLGAEHRTCCIGLQLGQRSGALYLRDGEIVHAECELLGPADAAFDLLSWRGADASIGPVTVAVSRTLHEPLTFLLLEALRRHDEGQVANESDDSVEAVSWSDPDGASLSVDACVRLVRSISSLAGVCAVEAIDLRAGATLARWGLSHRFVLHADLLSQSAHVAREFLSSVGAGGPQEIVICGTSLFCFLRLLSAPSRMAISVLCDNNCTTLAAVRLRVNAVLQSVDGSTPVVARPALDSGVYPVLRRAESFSGDDSLIEVRAEEA